MDKKGSDCLGELIATVEKSLGTEGEFGSSTVLRSRLGLQEIKANFKAYQETETRPVASMSSGSG